MGKRQSKIYMLVGIVASGKSTIADKLKKNGAKVHSSDSIREELFNDINSQVDNELVFKTLHNRIKSDIQRGYDVVYDATNISMKKRMAFLREIKNMNVKKVAIVMATPYEQALINNASRERKVPEYVIEKMYKGFQVPQYFEGWDKISILYYKNIDEKVEKMYKIDDNFNKMLNNFNQDNKHHSLTLGGHMSKTSSIVFDLITNDTVEEYGLIIASKYHDLGKLKTKSFLNGRGEVVESATYYSHDNISAYDSLFYLKDNIKRVNTKHLLNIIFYIQYHMQPFHWQGESAKNKFKELVGEEKFDNIMILHEADKKAH